jgi:hypothetical protein
MIRYPPHDGGTHSLGARAGLVLPGLTVGARNRAGSASVALSTLLRRGNPVRIRMSLVPCSAVLAIGATGCASSGLNHVGAGVSGSPGTGGSTPSSASFDPLALVGLWQVKAPGQAAGSALRLGDDLFLWSGCGHLMGDGRQTRRDFSPAISWVAAANACRQTPPIRPLPGWPR